MGLQGMQFEPLLEKKHSEVFRGYKERETEWE